MTDDVVIESFRTMREESRERRAANREASPKILTAAGIAFTVHGNGVHLIVDGRYDFWPGTGLWKPRNGGAGGRGVRNLIARIQALANERAVEKQESKCDCTTDDRRNCALSRPRSLCWCSCHDRRARAATQS